MNKKATFFSKNIDRVSGALYTGRMNKERLFALVRGLEGAALDCPFEDDFETTVFRHAADRRWFGIYLAVPKRYFGDCLSKMSGSRSIRRIWLWSRKF